MADLKISQLTELATFADDDLLAIVDTSATETKKVEWGAMKTALASVFWKLDGNTVGSEKWIGTIDNFDFPIRTNNVQIAEFSAAGNFGIGVAPNAAYRLHSKGSTNDGTTSSAYLTNSDDTIAWDFKTNGNLFIYNILWSSVKNGLPTWGQHTFEDLTSATTSAAFGNNALRNLQSGEGNFAGGDSAGDTITTGSFNTFLGQNSGFTTNGTGNTYDGASAGYFSTGNNVVFVGYRSGVNAAKTAGITSGDGVTAIGGLSGLKHTNGAIANSTYVGFSTVAEASSEVVIGGLTNNNFYFGIGKFGSAADRTAIIMQPSSVPSGSDYYANETDGNGVNWTFAVSRATGSGTSGDMIWQYAPSGSTGTTLTTLTEAMRLKGTTGQLQFSTIGAIFNPYGVSSGNTGELRFAELAAGGTNYVGFKAADAIGTTVIWTLPDSDSTGTQALVSNGSGVLSWASIGGGGTVTSVSGTANRITSTGGATPVIDIASTYVGQNSITTLGTVTTGTLSTGAVIGGVTMTLGSDATGDIYYRNAGGVLTRLAIGSNTDILTVTAGLPSWTAAPTAGANTALSNLASVAINTTLLPGSNDGAALGSGTLSFSDLFLASGGLINFANGNSVITHSSAVLTVSTGDLRVTTAGTNATSVATLDGTQTLTNKSIVATQLTGTAYTMAVNNTSGTAAYTLTNYRNDVIADFDGTFTWNSTPPSTIVSQKYVMSRIGNMVILTISVLYTSTGTTNTTCIVTFPSTAPAPAVLAASGDAASEYMYPICGARVEANQTANPSAIRGGIRRNSGGSAFEILLIFGSTSALQLQVTVIYFTA